MQGEEKQTLLRLGLWIKIIPITAQEVVDAAERQPGIVEVFVLQR